MVKGLFMATVKFKIDFDESKSKYPFSTLKRLVEDGEMLNALKEGILKEIWDEEMGECEVEQTYARLWRLDENGNTSRD